MQLHVLNGICLTLHIYLCAYAVQYAHIFQMDFGLVDIHLNSKMYIFGKCTKNDIESIAGIRT